MREKWILETKRGDFNGLAKKLQVPPLLIKCMINRGIESEEQMRKFLYGTLEDLHNPLSMKDMDRAVELVKKAREQETKLAIASDFDCDGIFSGYLLWKGFTRIGIDSKIFTPDRVQEGYGLNERIIREAKEEGRTFLVTCDNGIAANAEVALAKEQGMTVLVTDHHEVQEELPAADAVLDMKQEGETYPFSGLCGCGVAYKLICALYDEYNIPTEEKEELLVYVAIATVADVMELVDENRILVKYGLKLLSHTSHVGLRALLEVQGLAGKELNGGHIGFVIGPCFNAAGRIATVDKSFALLMETDYERALEKAEELKEINESRKRMTEEGAERAYELVEQRLIKSGKLPPVLILSLSSIHESLAGIIAGRVKERYHHPVIVFTDTEEGVVKGSGRSIEAYHMFQQLLVCKDLMLRFGGHKMAAGMTLKKENLPELDRRLNEAADLIEEDFRPVIRIDAAMPVGFVTEHLVKEFARLEPFGVANPKPVFAEQHFRILYGRRLGKEGKVLKLKVQNEKGSKMDAVLFRDVDAFEAFVCEQWGENELRRMYEGRENILDIAFTYYPSVNEYNGNKTVQIQIISYCHVAGTVNDTVQGQAEYGANKK